MLRFSRSRWAITPHIVAITTKEEAPDSAPVHHHVVYPDQLELLQASPLFVVLRRQKQRSQDVASMYVYYPYTNVVA